MRFSWKKWVHGERIAVGYIQHLPFFPLTIRLVGDYQISANAEVNSAVEIYLEDFLFESNSELDLILYRL